MTRRNGGNKPAFAADAMDRDAIRTQGRELPVDCGHFNAEDFTNVSLGDSVGGVFHECQDLHEPSVFRF